MKETVVFLSPKVDHVFYLLFVSTVEMLNPHPEQTDVFSQANFKHDEPVDEEHLLIQHSLKPNKMKHAN